MIFESFNSFDRRYK